MNRLLSFKLLAIIILTFVSCSKDSDEPEPAETSVTTSDFSTTMDENPASGQVIGTVSGSANQGTISFSLIEELLPEHYILMLVPEN